uniref:DUF1758 domain-containing protein n=1 Tax=Trichuris muris TaxID=70415 RepID=A0A5S6Q5P7_TRIMR
MSTKRILNQRDGLKGGIERLLSEAQTQAANGEHRLALRTLEVLDTYLTKCRGVENDLQSYLQDDDLQKEVSGWMDFELSVVEAKARIDDCLRREEKSCISSAVEQHEPKAVGPGPHLPKWNLPVFSGNVLEFVAFWDQFDSGVHSRQELSDVTKFIYLKSALRGPALEAVAGLSITSANYAIAVDLLKNRFGRPNVIVQNHILSLLEMPSCTHASAERLRQLHDNLNWHVRALCAMGKDPASQLSAADVLLCIFKMKLPHVIRKKWETELLINGGEVSLDTLFHFLQTHVEVEESVTGATPSDAQKTVHFTRPRKPIPTERLSTTSMLQTSVVSDSCRCLLCSADNHEMAACPAFVRRSVKQRWRVAQQHRVCFVCLRQGHSSADCDARSQRCKFPGCSNRSHNQLLHYTNDSKKSPKGSVISIEPTPGESTENSVRIGFARTDDERVLLQTAQARLFCDNGNTAVVTCLLDIGSQRSFIRKDLADNLGLKGPNEPISILSFGSRKGRLEATKRVRFCLSPIFSCSTRKWLAALCVPRICAPLQSNPPIDDSWKHLQGCRLSDRYPRGPVEVDVLIGADYYYNFVHSAMRKGSTHGPIGIHSVFGWILSGRTGQSTNKTAVTLMCQICEDDSADALLRQFWQLDALGIIPEKNGEEPTKADRHQAKQVAQFNGERYIVSLPWKAEMNLPNNFEYALQRLEQLEKRMKKRPAEAAMYIAAMKEYIDKGWVEDVHSPAEVGREWYLPPSCCNVLE